MNDGNALLPNGTPFAFWETDAMYGRELHVRAGTAPGGDGTPERPFAAINDAAALATPGTRVVIHAGVYRECVRPARGGTDPAHLISYEAAGDGPAIITANEIADAFTRSRDYKIEPDTDGAEAVIWRHRLNGELFHGYNPFGVVNCIHEKEWLRYARVDTQSSLTPYFLRRGRVFVDGEPLRQVQLYRLMRNAPGTYWVEEDGLTVHFRLPDDGDPAQHTVEVSCREQNFAPSTPFLGYIRVKGLTLLGAANGAPVPQMGALSCNRGHHWIVEGCTVGHANALGMDIGNVAWSLKRVQPVGYAVVRGNTFHDCGVCGLAGLYVTDTLVEDNLFTRTGWQRMEYGWEASALKFHDCENCLFRRNIFRDSENCDGLWLDCANYNDRITQNLFLDICSPHGMIFIECNRGGLTPREVWIDNNVLWNSVAYQPPEPGKETITHDSTHWNEPFELATPIGDGIAGYGSDDLRIEHNFIGCMDGFGYSQNVIRGRMHDGRGGTSRHTVVRNNVFYRCKVGAIRLPNHDHEMDGNCYSNVPQGFLWLTYPAPSEQLDLAAWQRFEGFDLHGGYAAFDAAVDRERLTLTITRGSKRVPWDDREGDGYASMPRVETDIPMDFFGRPTGALRRPGPFELSEDTATLRIDPRLDSRQ